MNNFGQIFSFLNKRKKLVKKLIKANNELSKIEKELKEIEQPFLEAKIDVQKYRDFISKYYIESEDGSKHIAKDIYLTKDCDGNPFYQVTYIFEDNNSTNKGALSLRKFLHILDYPNAQLKKFQE